MSLVVILILKALSGACYSSQIA